MLQAQFLTLLRETEKLLKNSNYFFIPA